MLHIEIIAIGFTFTILLGVLTFIKAKKVGNPICEVASITTVTTGLFGIVCAIYIGMVSPSTARDLAWIGASWFSIINGSVTCALCRRFIATQLSRTK